MVVRTYRTAPVPGPELGVDADVALVDELVVTEPERPDLLEPHPAATSASAHMTAALPPSRAARIISGAYLAPASLIRRSMSSSLSKSAASAWRYSTPSPLRSCARTST